MEIYTILIVCPLSVYLDNPDSVVGDIESTVLGDVGADQGQVPPLTLQGGNVLLYILNHYNTTNQSPNLLTLTDATAALEICWYAS